MLNQIVEGIKRGADYLPGNMIIYQLSETLERMYYTRGIPQLFGYTAEEYKQIAKGDPYDLIHPSDRDIIAENVRQCAQKGIDRNFVFRIMHKTNGYIWVHTATRMLPQTEKPLIVAGFVNIDNEMMSTGLILNASERGAVLLDADSREVLYANHRFLSIAGVTQAECYGHPCNEVICKMGAWDREKCVCFRMAEEGKAQIIKGTDERFFSMSCKRVTLGEHNALAYFLDDVTKRRKAEKDLQEKNDELNHILDSIAGGVSTYLVDGDKVEFVSYTPGLARVLGYTAEEFEHVMGQNALNYVYEGDHDIIHEKIREMLSTGLPTAVAYRILRRDGVYTWFRATLYPAGERRGLPLIYDVLTDIAQANAYYQDALDQTNEMVIIADWTTRELFYLNKAAADVNGRTLNELMGCKCSQIARHTDTPCPYCFKEQLTYDALFTKEMHVGSRYFLTKGKRIKWNGREAFVEYVSDVTAQHNMTEKAVFDRNLLTSATRAVFPLCIITNLTKNTYEIVEYDHFSTQKANTSGCFDDLISVGASTIPDEDRQAFIDAFSRENLLREHAAGKRTVTLVHRQTGDDGKLHWNRTIVVFAGEMYDGDLYSITMTDSMDELKGAEAKQREAMEAAQRANQAKTDFLSRVSHDMRTPLNGILGLTALLKEKALDDAMLSDLKQLEMSGRYLLNLINDTLDVSRIESGKLELHPVVCDGRSVFDNVLGLVQPNLQAKHIQFNVKTENLPFTVLYVDVGRVEQIVMNILGNAIKFTKDGGRIDFTMTNLSVEDGIITDQVVVRDTGIGMSEEFLPHLFEPFSQEDHGRTSSFQGTGLGMTITKQIIEMMGGTIHVESKLGVGTTFTFTLKMPIATEKELEGWQNNKAQEYIDTALSGKRVLLCEDHPLNATIAKRLLTGRGMLVEHAENGAVGVEMFDKSPLHYYDVVLMDIRMPVMDGIEATRRIRALPREDAKNMPIVAMTANAFDEDVQMTREAGMNAHLSKPIETAKLYDTLEKMLGLRRQVRRRVILVVDDLEINRAAITAGLVGEYTVLEASGGAEALELLEKHHEIDAVITDIQMPDINGFELIRRIRADQNKRHIIIIANTQFGDLTQEESLLALGANDFVYKPTTPRIVEIRVRNALRRL